METTQLKHAAIVLSALFFCPPLYAEEADESDGCPEGQIMVEGECRGIVYEKKGVVDFDGLEVNALREGPWGAAVFEVSPLQFSCEAMFEKAAQSKSPKDEAAYLSCLGITPTPSCPEGQLWVSGKCRDPNYLARITKHTYAGPVEIKQSVPIAVTKPADPNIPFNQEAQELGKKLRESFDQSQQCPRDSKDIELLEKLASQAKTTDLPPVNVITLIATPQNPQSSQPDPGLARACGYSETYQEWFDVSFHCTDSQECFNQGSESRPHTCSPYRRLSSESNLWVHEGHACDGDISYRYGGQVGDMVLIPLGEGVFVRVFQDNQGAFYHGLIFAPTAIMKTETTVIEQEKTTILSPEQQLHNDTLTVQAWQRWAESPDGRAVLADMDEAEQTRLLKMLGAAKKHIEQ